MPNHVTTLMRVSPEVAEVMIHRFTEEEMAKAQAERDESDRQYKERTGNDWPYQHEPLPTFFIDFNRVIPQPEDMFQGGCDMNHPHPKPEGGFYSACWYNWNVANWGTKWGAYDASVEIAPGDLAVLRFDTAWSHPLPVVAALSRRFPEERIDVMYADEDLGYNVGAYVMQGGEIIEERTPEGGATEARDLAAQIKYGKTYKEMLVE